MSSSNRYRLLKTNQSGRPEGVGNFFELLTQELLGATSLDCDLGDLVMWDTSTGVEVKATSGSDGHRLALDQLTSHRATASGFLNSYVYCLYRYRNRRREGTTYLRPMSCCKTRYDLHRYLAHNVMQLLLVDIGLIGAVQQKLGLTKGRLPGRPNEPLLYLPHRFLHQFQRGNEHSIFNFLDLNRSNWTIREWNVAQPLTLSPRVGENLELKLGHEIVTVRTQITAVMPRWHINKIAQRPFRQQICAPRFTDQKIKAFAA